jgi:V/A-type H+/Na+-transporting ATPase subunit I
MREDVKKFLFLGLEEDKKSFFEKAQKAGLIHFIDPYLNGKKEAPLDVQQLVAAIKVLRGLSPLEQEENYRGLDLNSVEVAKTILSLHEKNLQLTEELRVLNLETARIDVFGYFSLEDIAWIEKEGQCTVQFFSARPSLFEEEPEPEGLIFIAQENGLNYYLAINDQPVAYDRMFEMKIERSLADLKQRQRAVHVEQHQVEKNLRPYAKYNDFLHAALIELLNRHHLFDTQAYVQHIMEGSLFGVEGWVPANKVKELEELTEPLAIVTEEIAIEPTDEVPTYLENQGASRLGEDLVHIYDTPSSSDRDPSLWVLGAFALFFAIIIGDAGYGFLYLCLALFLRYKFPDLKGLKKRTLNLFTLLSVGCIVWGVLTTSFFGMKIDINNPVRQFSLVQWLATKKLTYHIEHQDEIYKGLVHDYPELTGNDDSRELIAYIPSADAKKGTVVLSRISDHIMFELALFIGIVHLITSLLRYCRRTPSNLGWVAFLIGAYLYFAAYLQAPTILNYVVGIDLIQGGVIGLELMLGGLGFAWIVSIIMHGWSGIFEIVNVIQVFADTLSYLRLYALGLAGAIVASTVNDIAAVLPTILAVFLIVLSHFINIILATMSGVIHGLRLNFLEWYHYSFEGGGKQFKPLKLLKME